MGMLSSTTGTPKQNKAALNMNVNTSQQQPSKPNGSTQSIESQDILHDNLYRPEQQQPQPQHQSLDE
jgi:hypothetical protein